MGQSNKQQLKIEVESLRSEVASLKQALNAFAQTEAALRDSEARFRSLSDASPIGIFQTDVRGYCSYTNARWQSLTGLSFQESLGEGWAKAIHPDDRDTVFAHWNQCVQEGREYEQQFRFLSPQGKICWVHARAAAIRDELGEIVGYVGTDEDVSETKIAEVVRKEATRQLIEMGEALSNAVEGISRLDSEGNYYSVNEAYARMVGYEPDEMVGMPWPQTVHPEGSCKNDDGVSNHASGRKG